MYGMFALKKADRKYITRQLHRERYFMWRDGALGEVGEPAEAEGRPEPHERENEALRREPGN